MGISYIDSHVFVKYEKISFIVKLEKSKSSTFKENPSWFKNVINFSFIFTSEFEYKYTTEFFISKLTSLKNNGANIFFLSVLIVTIKKPICNGHMLFSAFMLFALLIIFFHFKIDFCCSNSSSPINSSFNLLKSKSFFGVSRFDFLS